MNDSNPNSLTEPILPPHLTYLNTGHPAATWDQDFNDPRPRFYTAQYIAKQNELYGADRHAGRDFDYEAFREDMAAAKSRNQRTFGQQPIGDDPDGYKPPKVEWYDRICRHCGARFKSTSYRARMCSDTCRKAAKADSVKRTRKAVAA